ncbi:hypothetical protein CVT24_011759 [Panaeolus cyanescens]|uniref:Ubiquitin-like protease family profile domain-containing protein n=1 Tax=Panaeolus cyanescens TaxID=181874 RepID=A0A409YNE9_9AGAR|nr:hypothetical protein CVT24_011759 [Panaeolus cyanescens]
MPAYVIKAKDVQLQIPHEYHSILPDPSASVSTLLQCDLPQQSDCHSELLLDGDKRLWFHFDAPSSDVSVLLHRPIPSAQCLNELESSFGQAWLDGCKSVSDKRAKKVVERFPLWIIRLWREMATVLRGQLMWRRSLRWLETEKRLAKEGAETTMKDVLGQTERVQKAFEWLPWNSPMAFKGRAIYNTLQLTGFLGSGWLNDTHINIMLEVLPDQSVDTGRNKIVVPMSFYELVNFRLDSHLSQSMDKMQDSFLGKLATRIKANGVRQLYLPIHVNDNHWIAGRIDFEDRTVSYADSLSIFGGHYPKFHKQLIWWLRFWFGKSFATTRSEIPFIHAIQSDSVSCGIITLNTIEHALCEEPLWTSTKTTFERLKWFLRTIDFHTSMHNPASVQILVAPIDSRDLFGSDAECELNDQISSDKSIDFASSSESSESDSEFLDSEFSGSNDSSSRIFPIQWEALPMDVDSAPTSLLSVDHLPPRSPSANSEFSGSNDSSSRIFPIQWEALPMDVDSAPTSLLSVDHLPPRSPSASSFSGSIQSLSARSSASYLSTSVQSHARPSSSLSHISYTSGTSASSQKRSRVSTGSDYTASSSTLESSASSEKPKAQSGTGTSRSAINGRKLRKKTGTNSFPANKDSTRYRSWKTKILSEDPEAGFDEKDHPFQAQCSVCKVWVKGKGGGDTTRFKDHKKICPPSLDEITDKKPPKKKGKRSEDSAKGNLRGVSTLTRLWPGLKSSQSGNDSQPKKITKARKARPPPVLVPCPGLTSREDPRIDTYLNRTATRSGGGRAKHVVAVEMFGVTYSGLTHGQKQVVKRQRETEMRWVGIRTYCFFEL